MQQLVLGESMARAHRAEIVEYMRAWMPMQHRDFFAALPFLFLGYVDDAGYPWATVLSHASDDVFRSRDSSHSAAADDYHDEQGTRFSLLAAAVHPGEQTLVQQLLRDDDDDDDEPLAVGLLGIDTSNRRRNRLNGVLSRRADGEGRLRGSVQLSFGNCPKYINLRSWQRIAAGDFAQQRRSGVQWSCDESGFDAAELLSVVRGADCFFVASAHPHSDDGRRAAGVDVSHRGGQRGFVQAQLSDDGQVQLRWPDYVGNAFFNTLGNIVLNPRVGLLFADFASGDAWQLSGRAVVNTADRSLPGAERSVSFTAVRVRKLTAAFAVRFAAEPSEYSPFNPSADEQPEPLHCVSSLPLAAGVRSYTFALARPRKYLPGQYGVFVVDDGSGETVQRAWTVSSTPQQGSYGERSITITVKSKPGGRVSPRLEQLLASDPDALSLLGPFQGDFSVFHSPATGGWADPTAWRHVVYIAAGTGITPVVSQLRMLVAMRGQLPDVRVSLLYYCRTADEALFADELRRLAAAWPNLALLTSYTCPSLSAATRLSGRPSDAHLAAIAGPTPDVAFVCGPEGFMHTVEQLVRTHWPSAAVKRESFAF